MLCSYYFGEFNVYSDGKTLNITQSTTYKDSKPLVTCLTVYNSGAILGNSTYKLSNLLGKEISEKLMLIVEQGSISVYHDGNRINKMLGNYDGNGLINRVE